MTEIENERESEGESCMEWMEEVIYRFRKVWGGVSTRLGIRKSGLLKLRQDIRTCEYEDVHVMWEMLKRTEAELARTTTKKQKKALSKVGLWARSASALCVPFDSTVDDHRIVS